MRRKNINKMKNKTARKIKCKKIFLPVLIMFSLFSLGFSSWLISYDFENIGIDLTKGDILKMIVFKGKNGTDTICKYGFLNDRGEVKDSCTYEYKYELNQIYLNNFFNDNQFNFSLLVMPDENSAFMSLIANNYVQVDYSFLYNGTASERISFNSDNNTLSSIFDVNDVTSNEIEELRISLNLSIATEKKSDFISFIDSLPLDTNFNFLLDFKTGETL